ncbi:MAG TPA: hypothetical protein VIZ28_12650 [Chitinophagaceae bacterium]
MFEFNVIPRNISWKIENSINFWQDKFWHNIVVTVNDNGQVAEYKVTKLYEPNQKLDSGYWFDVGNKVAELFENIDLKRRLDTLK